MEMSDSPPISHEAEVAVAQIRIDGPSKAKQSDVAISTEFASVLTAKIQELEARGPAAGTAAERDPVKARRVGRR
jgi:hypothetical protein